MKSWPGFLSSCLTLMMERNSLSNVHLTKIDRSPLSIETDDDSTEHKRAHIYGKHSLAHTEAVVVFLCIKLWRSIILVHLNLHIAGYLSVPSPRSKRQHGCLFSSWLAAGAGQPVYLLSRGVRPPAATFSNPAGGIDDI